MEWKQKDINEHGYNSATRDLDQLQALPSVTSHHHGIALRERLREACAARDSPDRERAARGYLARWNKRECSEGNVCVYVREREREREIHAFSLDGSKILTRAMEMDNLDKR